MISRPLTDAGTRMYSHAFATLFLSQVYGMTGAKSPAVMKRLKAAVDLIVDRTANTWEYEAASCSASQKATAGRRRLRSSSAAR